MDSKSFQEYFEVELEHLDKEKVENGMLKFKLRRAEGFIRKLKEQLEASRNHKQDLMDKIQEDSDNDTSYQVKRLEKEKEEINIFDDKRDST